MTILISTLISLVLIVGAVILLVRLIERRTRPAKIMSRLRSEVSEVIADLNGTTDRNLQLLEDRIAQLKAMLEQADKRIQTMSTELEKARRGDDVYARLRKARTAGVSTGVSASVSAAGMAAAAQGDAAGVAPGTAGVAPGAAGDAGTAGVAGTAGAAPGSPGAAAAAEAAGMPAAGTAASAPAPTDASPNQPSAGKKKPASPAASGQLELMAAGSQEDSPADTARQLRARVWEMHAMGESVEYIAATTGRTEGEIELMVSLLQKA